MLSKRRRLRGRAPLSTVKLLKADPALVLAQSEEIKARYAKIFGV